MSQVFHYGWEGVDTDLGTEVARLGEYGGYSIKAWAGEIGNCELIFDDPDNDLPDSGLEGLGNLWVEEDACAAVGADGVNGTRLFSGYIGERTYGRGDSVRSSLRVGPNRQVSVVLSDLNAVASFMLLHTATANRPAETDVERVQWLLSDPDRPLWSATDAAGYVDTSNPVNMDACNYTLQSPQQVLGDCAVASGKNWFIGYWEATGDAFLWYADSNTSTNFTSLLAISNDLDDVDYVTTFPPALGTDAKLVRTPDRRYKGVAVNFANGYAYKTNSDAALGYAWRDGSAPNGNVSTQAAADALAQRLANDAVGEEDRLSCTVQLPASLATGIKAGQRIQCKFTHLPGYETFTWMRVTSLQIAQDEPTDQRYTLSLEMTPQAAAAQSQHLLIALVLASGIDDHSANPWTVAHLTANFAYPAQTVACGAGPPNDQGMAIMYRNVVPGESADVLAFIGTGPAAQYSAWVFEVAGVTLGATPTVLSGMSVLPSGNTASISTTAAAASVLFGAIGFAKVNYDGGWCAGGYGASAVVSTVAGTPLIGANGASEGNSCNAANPWAWAAYATGTGTLSVSASANDQGGGAYACGFMIGTEALLLPTTGTFSVVQSAFGAAGAGGTAQVILSSPPG